jgi:hypothetical protein
MKKLICDCCKKESRSLYTFDIGFEGATMIGGMSLTWSGRRGITDHSGPYDDTIELCGECADALVEKAQEVLEKRKARV